MRGFQESEDRFLVPNTTPVDLRATGSPDDSQDDALLVEGIDGQAR